MTSAIILVKIVNHHLILDEDVGKWTPQVLLIGASARTTSCENSLLGFFCVCDLFLFLCGAESRTQCLMHARQVQPSLAVYNESLQGFIFSFSNSVSQKLV